MAFCMFLCLPVLQSATPPVQAAWGIPPRTARLARLLACCCRAGASPRVLRGSSATGTAAPVSAPAITEAGISLRVFRYFQSNFREWNLFLMGERRVSL